MATSFRLALVAAAALLLPIVGSGSPAAAMPAAVPGTVQPPCVLAVPDAAFPKTLSKYRDGDATRSVEDEARSAARARALEPIRRFVSTIDGISVAHRTAPGNGATARCALSALADWARAGALLRLQSEDAHLSRDVIVASLSAAYRRMADAPIDPADRAAIEGWLSEVGRDTVAFYRFKAGPKSRMNNHRYWAGVAVTAAGLAAGDDRLTAWGAEALRIGLCQIRDDGTLPLELARGTKALQYHAYALRALSELRDLQDEAGTAGVECGDRLARLERLVTEWSGGGANPTALRQETLTGASLAFVQKVRFGAP